VERKQFAAALGAAQALSTTVPENRDVLYMTAVSLRCLQRVPEALTTLERLERLQPRFSRLFQERGHCYVALRDAPRAIDAFLTAVNINPALPASWRVLHSLYQMTAQPENAAMAAGHMEALANLPAEIVTATALFSDGELAAAEAMVRPYLLQHGDHIEGMRLLARIGLAHDVLDDADVLLEAVLALAPGYQAARYDYAIALLRRHKHQQAITELEKLLQSEPDNRAYATTYATAKVGLGEHEAALDLYRKLVADARMPVQASELHLSIAHSLKALGRQTEAIEAPLKSRICAPRRNCRPRPAPIGTTCASRSARPSRIGASTPTRFIITNVATP
jgi:predicted Zn-dependent protease